MRRSIKRAALVIVLAVVAMVVVIAGATAFAGPEIIGIGSSFFAKQLCSGVFVSGRRAEDVAARDLHVYSPTFIMRSIGWRIDDRAGTVTTSWYGMAERVARHRPGYGCALVFDAPLRTLPPRPAVTSLPADAPWPEGERVDTVNTAANLDRDALTRAVASAFENGPGTRAVVVVHRGRIVAERYAEGIKPEMPLPGWSMAKSVMNALVGTLVRDGRLQVDAPLALAAWSSPDEPRRAITFGHALGMVTGLAFDESPGNPLSDVTRMLFTTGDAARYAALRSLASPPGTTWAYASGTTNLVSAAMRARLGDDAYLRYPTEALFARIGMRSAVIEPDATGTFIGSSFLYATARDWARFGLLFAQDGVWAGERVLPEGWVTYSHAPVPASSGRYGAHFWRGLDDVRGELSATEAEAFHAAGHAGQRVVIVPSRRLVLVRLAVDVGAPRFDTRRFAEQVMKALPPE